jgi:DNA-3-methyladenine glycosylase II
MKPSYWNEAVRALSRADPVLRRLVRRYPDVHLKRRGDPFSTLARAIVAQQISVAAADAI